MEESELSTSQFLRQAIYFALLLCGIFAGVIGQKFTDFSLPKFLIIFLLASIATINIFGAITKRSKGRFNLSTPVQVVVSAILALTMGGVLGSLFHGL